MVCDKVQPITIDVPARLLDGSDGLVGRLVAFVWSGRFGHGAIRSSHILLALAWEGIGMNGTFELKEY